MVKFKVRVTNLQDGTHVSTPFGNWKDAWEQCAVDRTGGGSTQVHRDRAQGTCLYRHADGTLHLQQVELDLSDDMTSASRWVVIDTLKAYAEYPPYRALLTAALKVIDDLTVKPRGDITAPELDEIVEAVPKGIDLDGFDEA